MLNEVTIAGGGAYVFAKRSVNAGRNARHEEDQKRRRLKDSLEAEFLAKSPSPKHNHRKTQDHASSPSTEASNDPAPSEYLHENSGGKVEDGNKYLAAKPYKSKKGDRFS